MKDRVGTLARLVLGVIVACAIAPVAHAQPANDLCANATPIQSGAGSYVGDLAGATRDAVGTSCPSSQSGVDVYYVIAPAAAGLYTFDTCGATFDTVLSVHTLSCPVGVGTELPAGCNDDSCGFQSRVAVPLQAGVSYIVRVGTYNASTIGGSFPLNVGFVPTSSNDECGPTNPEVFLNVPVIGDNLGATTSFVVDPASACGPFAGSGGGADVFYAFHPPTTGAYTFSTCGSTLDSVISVHAACPATASNILACNDDAGTTLCSSNRFASIVTAPLIVGQRYTIRVAGYRSDAAGTAARGQFVLTVSDSSMPYGACCDSSGLCTLVLSGSCFAQYLGDAALCTPLTCTSVTQGACCSPTGTCWISDGNDCDGTYVGDGTTCTPQSCPELEGACCVGANCFVAQQSQCQPVGSAGAVFAGPGVVCQTGATTQPCCLADFNKIDGVSIQDIFDYLNEWFAGSPSTVVGGSGQSSPAIQDIFAFLNLWFAGGC